MWTLSANKNWDILKSKFEWVRDMQGVPQDSIYHAEGDVEVHTQMVLHEIELAAPFFQNDKENFEILWAAGLMHDIEKRSTTVHEPDGRITSAGHAKKGEYTVRSILYKDIPTPFRIRESIAKLVRYHGYPLWFMEKPDIVKTLFRNAFEVDYQLLYYLSHSDVKGRICSDQDNLLAGLDLFKDAVCSNNIWSRYPDFLSQAHRFEYFNIPDRVYDYVPYENYKSDVYMLSGLPGSGKDTWISNCNLDLPVLSLDNIRRKHKIDPTDKSGNGKVVQLAKEQAKEYLRKGQSFILNSTNITRQMREIWIDLFTTYKAKTRIVYLEVPYSKLLKQNREREYALPQVAIEKMIPKLEIPQYWEAHSLELKVSE